MSLRLAFKGFPGIRAFNGNDILDHNQLRISTPVLFILFKFKRDSLGNILTFRSIAIKSSCTIIKPREGDLQIQQRHSQDLRKRLR